MIDLCSGGYVQSVKRLKHSLSKMQKGGDLVGSHNSVTKNIKLPWARFPGEMHLPGHSFTGPSTRLDLRLNPDGTPKTFSKPVDRVDNAALRQDLAYGIKECC